MASGARMFKEHFFLSNKFVQSILGLRPDQSQNDQLFLVCAVTLYVFPGMVHQFYQLFTSEILIQLAVKVLQKTMGIIVLLVAYSTTYFSFRTMKLILTNYKAFCEQMSSEEELTLLENSLKQNKLYAYIVFGLFNGYCISIIAPCIVKVCLYFLGILDENQLPLIVPVNNMSQAGVKYFCLLIYQIIAVILVITVGAVSFSAYLLAVLFACDQFHILILKIQRPFDRTSKYNGKDCFFRKPEEEWDWVIDVINTYKKVAAYVDLLNDFSKMTYLITSAFAITLIFFDFVYIFQLSIDLQNASEIIECSFYIVGSLVTIYINFYFGQELMNYGHIVFKELCQVPFYILSSKSQKILLFMIIRSCKPIMLSIGGMFVSSHESFAVLMRKAFSFAMVYYNYV